MLRKIESKTMGSSDLGWLRSNFHFSFADYFNPLNINFGALRVLNDDIIEPNTGFDPHPHKDMEIITYVVKGELTHGDSMGNQRTITRGEVQYMSAGTGVFHSEHNYGSVPLRLLQIWLHPDKRDYAPTYGDYSFPWRERHNRWLHMVSGKNGVAPITINQDVNLYTLELLKDQEITFHVKEGRQAYLVQIEGASIVNQIELEERDALEVVQESLIIKAKETSHNLILEMKST